MDKKYKWAGIALVIGSLGGYMLRPEPEIKIKEVVKVERQVDEKIKIVESPDGTKVTTIDREAKEEINKKLDIEQKNPDKDWLIGVERGFDERSWGVQIQRRVLGDIYLGGSVNVRGDVTANLSILF